MISQGEDSAERVIGTLTVEELDDDTETNAPIAMGIPRKEGGREPTRMIRSLRRVIELLEGQTLRIGRARANDLVLPNKNVSRFHAVFSTSSTGIVLSDLSSLNGTLVNGTRISTPVNVGSGDMVVIGETRFTVHLGIGEGNTEDSMLGRTQSAKLSAVMVTVLVADVVGYTKLSEALPPSDVAEMMHCWFERVSETIEKFGGETDKYIGDCVMALWRGSPTNAGAFTEHAVRAGLDILETTKKLSMSSNWKYHQSFPWECRVALNTGEALMGTIGAASKRDFTVLGDTVNVAFRLEDMAGKMGCHFIFGNSTAELVKDLFAVEHLGKVSVEGRTEEVMIYTLAETSGKQENVLLSQVIASLEEMPLISEILNRLEKDLDPKYAFHSISHTRDVLHQAILFAIREELPERELELLAVAAAYHDAGFLERAEQHEELGAHMAEQAMKDAGGFSAEEIELVKTMILDTKVFELDDKNTRQARSKLAEYLLDADLSNFGRDDFFERLNSLCSEREMDRFTELKRTLSMMLDHKWYTDAAEELRQGKKEENLKTLRALLGK